ncbi:MAG: hypothetical protein VX764_04815 [Planctomycetota bacterium]|nr:hypothetical protein [Planctomycetota bacterium]
MKILQITRCLFRQPLLLLMLWISLSLSTGCGIIYQHRLETHAGTIWTNDDILSAKRYQNDLDWMQAGLRQHLPDLSRNVKAVTVLIGSRDSEGDRIVREQEVHTVGWYNRILSLVQFNPTSDAETQFLAQESDPPRHGTLLHELTHHFTSNHPALRSRWWLTEAFACYFETAFRDQQDRFILPPLHVDNYSISRRKLRELGSSEFSTLVNQITDANWLQFYRNDSEAPLRYAISWSILWALQQQMSGSLEQRLLQVAQLDDEQVNSRIASVIQALRPPLSDQLRVHLREPDFHRWAVEKWLENDRVDGPLILSVIEDDLDDEEGAIWGWPCVTRTVFRWGSRLPRSDRVKWQKRIEQQLRQGSLSVRLAICRVLPEYRRSGVLNAVLVDLLEADSGELRAAAAMALSRTSSHPTIVNPDFWINGSDEQRSAEVADWRVWLESP